MSRATKQRGSEAQGQERRSKSVCGISKSFLSLIFALCARVRKRSPTIVSLKTNRPFFCLRRLVRHYLPSVTSRSVLDLRKVRCCRVGKENS